MEGLATAVSATESCQEEVGDKVDRNPLHVDLSKIRTLLFDCDDTLYPRSRGVDVQVRRNIEVYMERELDIPRDQVPSLCMELYHKYGTTLRGLQALYNVDPNHYWAFVHGTLDYEKLIPRDDKLAEMLRSLPQRKLVFTNADREHAERCIEQLGLEGIFEDIVDVRAMEFENKPAPASYRTALRMAGETDPSRAMFFDDSAKNLDGARHFGIHTVRVAPGAESHAWDVANLDAIDEICVPLIDLWKFDPSQDEQLERWK